MAFELKIDDEVILAVSDMQEKIVKNSVPCFKEWIKQGILNIIKSKIGKSVIQIKIDDEVILNASNANIADEILLQHKNWIKTEIVNIIIAKIDSCRQKLDFEWFHEGCDDNFARIPSKIAKNGVTSIPDDKDEKAELIFSQPNYKNRVEQDVAAREEAVKAGIKV